MSMKRDGFHSDFHKIDSQMVLFVVITSFHLDVLP